MGRRPPTFFAYCLNWGYRSYLLFVPPSASRLCGPVGTTPFLPVRYEPSHWRQIPRAPSFATGDPLAAGPHERLRASEGSSTRRPGEGVQRIGQSLPTARARARKAHRSGWVATAWGVRVNLFARPSKPPSACVYRTFNLIGTALLLSLRLV